MFNEYMLALEVVTLSPKKSYDCVIFLLQLGNGQTGGYSTTPVNVAGLTGVSSIALGQVRFFVTV